MFSLKTSVWQCATFEEFAGKAGLGAGDLVITQSFLYEPYMKGLGLECKFVLQDRYGAGEPSDEMIARILDDLRAEGPGGAAVAGGAEGPGSAPADSFKRIVGIGGGTVIDIAKLFVLKGLEDPEAAYLREMPIVKGRELVIVPTTCGTGSEVTNISIAELKRKHTKLGLADNAILPDEAVLIPELLKGLPFKFYVYSAIDALIHAAESYVSPKATAHSRLFSEAAIHTILEVFGGIVERGEDYRFERLEDMLVAANMAGIAFGNAGCGPVHALSYPLGGNYHVPHGESNYQFFTHIFKLYSECRPEGRIADLNRLFAKELGLAVDAPAPAVYDALEQRLGSLIARRKLREYGMTQEEVRTFAAQVFASQQRLLANTYIPMPEEQIAAIYAALW
ncbi:MAG: 4-hydroxybutyrate dehydrogenase [Bacteroidales bacterium]|nr:4-hydroxybutyrate dehydrogenase [Bacteroidales bacterium]